LPEGPEVHREADRIRARIEKVPIVDVRFVHPALRRVRERVEGAHVERVRARGKAMLVDWSNGLTLYSHNQLYGRWIARAGSLAPETGRRLRVAIVTERGSAWLYSASDVALLETDRVDEHPYIAKLGIEILDASVTRPDLERWIASPRFGRRSLGALLLDQGFVAGIGNYLRSDILFEARLHPARKLGALDRNERRRLAGAIHRITWRAYETGGLTNPASRVRRLVREGVPRRAHRHLVFAREGRPCWTCATPIDRVVMAGRRLYLCCECQPEAGRVE
jgi:endonuclease-8